MRKHSIGICINQRLVVCCIYQQVRGQTSHLRLAMLLSIPLTPLKHWTAVKRILRYLKGTTVHGLLYSSRNTDDLHGYCDSDWAGDLDDRKSTSGYLFLLSGAPISWRSKKWSTVALSTAEEAMWLRQLISELKFDQSDATVLYEDNQAAICMTRNGQHNGRSKHIDIRCHFGREKVGEGAMHCSQVLSY